MKVLWMSINPALFRPGPFGNWSTALETALLRHHGDAIQLAVAFETDLDEPFKVRQEGVDYYPILCAMPRSRIAERWSALRAGLLAAIEDFRPDVIHCFGSEWLYGAVAREISVPIVVHMQGFLNIYHEMLAMAYPKAKPPWYSLRAAKARLRRFIRRLIHRPSVQPPFALNYDAFEREIMRSNHYFMGRTEWDRNIVKYYSPGAKYFYASEAIRPVIYEAAGTWRFRPEAKLRLLTVSLADDRKGNEIILRAARLLKDLLGLDFEWRVTGTEANFAKAEARSGLRHEQVNVSLIGKIDAPQIVSELREARLFVHPSLIDNSPNAICEAQLIGCPVVASNVGGVPQLVEHGQTGFLYPYSEPHALAFLIGNICADESLLTRVSKNEAACATKRHDPKLIADTVVSIYRAVVDDKSHGDRSFDSLCEKEDGSSVLS